MWSRHMYLPFRNVCPALAPYTDTIAFESATELLSSVFAAAGNDFDPVIPAFVAFIASTACSPNRLSSATRRSAAVIGAAFVIVIPLISWSALPLDDAARAPATSRPETPTAASAMVIVRVKRMRWISLVGDALSRNIDGSAARADRIRRHRLRRAPRQ